MNHVTFPLEFFFINPFNSTFSANVYTSDLKLGAELKLNELTVADWWIEEYNIPRERSHLEVNNVLSIGIDQAPPIVYGEHIYTLKSIELIGQWISKETLYSSIIFLWGLGFLIEMSIYSYQMRIKIKQDGLILSELEEKSALYKQQSETDKLTGISNREGLAQTLAIIEKNNEEDQYGLLILDIDYFKSVNDKHGHVIGDQILEELAKLISNNLRHEDLVARWGGEEFVILFRYSDQFSVNYLAEKIRMNVAKYQFVDGSPITITVSIGATTLRTNEKFKDSFIRADKALYEAKAKGRNRVVLADKS